MRIKDGEALDHVGELVRNSWRGREANMPVFYPNLVLRRPEKKIKTYIRRLDNSRHYGKTRDIIKSLELLLNRVNDACSPVEILNHYEKTYEFCIPSSMDVFWGVDIDAINQEGEDHLFRPVWVNNHLKETNKIKKFRFYRNGKLIISIRPQGFRVNFLKYLRLLSHGMSAEVRFTYNCDSCGTEVPHSKIYVLKDGGFRCWSCLYHGLKGGTNDE